MNLPLLPCRKCVRIIQQVNRHPEGLILPGGIARMVAVKFTCRHQRTVCVLHQIVGDFGRTVPVHDCPGRSRVHIIELVDTVGGIVREIHPGILRREIIRLRLR